MLGSLHTSPPLMLKPILGSVPGIQVGTLKLHRGQLAKTVRLESGRTELLTQVF